MKILTIAIPSYNSMDYMRNCIESLLPGGEDVEVYWNSLIKILKYM
jgi:glycosyltransferase involved in cell wall biosynthesis